jgi:hypothetical protein
VLLYSQSVNGVALALVPLLGTELHKGPRRNPAATSEEGATTGNGIRGRSRRQELRLGSQKTLHETLEQTLELEAVKLAVGISNGFRKMSDWTLWRGRPPSKLKKILLTTA